MLRTRIRWHWHLALGVLPFLLLAGLYSWRADILNEEVNHGRDADDQRPTVLPTWSRFVKTWVEATTPPAPDPDVEEEPDPNPRSPLWVAVSTTGYRFLRGLGLSIVIAVPLGLLMGCYAPIEAFFGPLLTFLAKVPATATYTVFLIVPFIGLSEEMYSALILFGVLPPLTLSVFLAARDDVPEELLFKARTLGASQLACIWDVIFAMTVPKIIDAIRLAVGPALIFLYAVEMLQDEFGIGGHMRLAGKKGVPGAAEVYMYLFIAGVLALGLDLSLRGLLRLLCPWYSQSAR
jgi:NitT/TauT family transport system permease protein